MPGLPKVRPHLALWHVCGETNCREADAAALPEIAPSHDAAAKPAAVLREEGPLAVLALYILDARAVQAHEAAHDCAVEVQQLHCGRIKPVHELALFAAGRRSTSCAGLVRRPGSRMLR